MKRIVHSRCGGTAFHYSGSTGLGAPILWRYVIYADGHTPKPSDKIRCESCGEFTGNDKLIPIDEGNGKVLDDSGR